jgi:AraC-like DNA-binding protein
VRDTGQRIGGFRQEEAGVNTISFDLTLPGEVRLRQDHASMPAHGLNLRARHRVDEFIERHLAERFTLADMADAACMSRFHFSRMFRLSFGVSPMEHVLRRRIERAKPMLLDKRLSIADVAATLGFCDQSHFTRSFRRITGYPPRQFIAHANRAERSRSPRHDEAAITLPA